LPEGFTDFNLEIVFVFLKAAMFSLFSVSIVPIVLVQARFHIGMGNACIRSRNNILFPNDIFR